MQKKYKNQKGTHLACSQNAKLMLKMSLLSIPEKNNEKKNVELDKKFAPPYIHQCPILCKVSEFCPFNDVIFKFISIGENSQKLPQTKYFFYECNSLKYLAIAICFPDNFFSVWFSRSICNRYKA